MALKTKSEDPTPSPLHAGLIKPTSLLQRIRATPRRRAGFIVCGAVMLWVVIIIAVLALLR